MDLKGGKKEMIASSPKYESGPVLLSQQVDGAFAHKYLPWKPHLLEIRDDLKLYVLKENSRKEKMVIEVIDLTPITLLAVDKEGAAVVGTNEIGVRVLGKKSKDTKIEFNCRIIFTRQGLEDFCDCIKSVSSTNNVDSFRFKILSHGVGGGSGGVVGGSFPLQIGDSRGTGDGDIRETMSSMRRAVTSLTPATIDKNERTQSKNSVKKK